MENDPRQNPRSETSAEVKNLRKLENLGDSSKAIGAYWDGRFKNVYLKVLEEMSELGRHGVIAEIINRMVQTGRVLDAGCGTGILSELLDLNRFTYIGIDLSKLAIQVARKKRSRCGVKFIVSPIEEFKSEGSFDVIVFNEVLYYLNYKRVLEMIRGLLRGPQLIVISIFDFKEGKALRRWLKNNMEITTEILVENTEHKLKWYVLTGHLYSKA